MAEMQDLEQETELGELETVEQQDQIEAEKPKARELPERFRGKTVEEIVKSHLDTERLLSKQGQELGEVRKLADELLRAQLAEKANKEKPEEVDFFENPQAAVNRAVEEHPKVKQAGEMAEQTRKMQVAQQLLAKHPDFQRVGQEEGFLEWVKANPNRAEAFKRAENFDFYAADDLLSTYKELRAVKETREVEADKEVRKKALSEASVDTGGSGETTKKIYRSKDLILLKIRNPAKYAAMEDEIYQAYAEGRVRR